MNYTRPIYLKSPQMYGDDVREVQKRLNALSYNAGTVDGYFGPNGRLAVLDFQDVNGLEIDGSVGPITWDKLFSSTAKPKPSNSGYTRPIYLTSPQMYGDDVKKVQRKLNSLNYNAGQTDGYFGPTGQAAVKDFQGVNGLAVDGSVGPTTWGKLFSPTAKSKPTTPSGIGFYYIDPIETSTPDLFTFSVRYGGDYPAGYDYRIYSHGATESQGAKIWYKQDTWQSGSTYEIYKAINAVNKAYNEMIGQLNYADAKDLAEVAAESLMMCAVATVTPIPFDDIITDLNALKVAKEIVTLFGNAVTVTTTVDFVCNMCLLKYHWSKI
ncbi:MAG: peptidoglycan-binding domain-containing protein [Paraclostridium sp.]